jgi:hypothetical protein
VGNREALNGPRKEMPFIDEAILRGVPGNGALTIRCRPAGVTVKKERGTISDSRQKIENKDKRRIMNG